MAKLALDAGADVVGGNANRLGVPPINIHNPTQGEYFLQKEVGMACMNGQWLKPLALRDVYEMRKMCGPDAILTGTGGVMTWQDAVEMIMCGADLVGLCTATLVNGFGFMPEFIHGFKQYLKEKGYKHPRRNARHPRAGHHLRARPDDLRRQRPQELRRPGRPVHLRLPQLRAGPGLRPQGGRGGVRGGLPVHHVAIAACSRSAARCATIPARASVPAA